MSTLGDRPDLRTATEMRPREARVGELAAYDGSAWIMAGGTSVVVGLTGPTAPGKAAHEKPDEAVVTVAVQRGQGLPNGGGASRILLDRRREALVGEDADVAEALRQCVSAAVQLREYPRCVFAFAVHVLSDDGGLLAAALNAAMLALLDAGVSCRSTFAASAVAVVPAPSSAGPSASTSLLGGAGELVIDPIADEEAVALATATYCHAIPATGGGVLLSKLRCKRPLPLSDAGVLERTAAGVAESVFDFYRQCLAPPEAEQPPAAANGTNGNNGDADDVVMV
eukprot:CAMPEP_0174833364 /NCGR_PEP_ID=MMETSP1114-20130205/4191_1 /TAXON_ID=312471 /ORGANISM="Neobodo designis, Strain CCAP 1951/1" /LENGTH=282 /DNA_ID=CAMNT_0016067245 /DNA_START=41 /DNA_END=889 /DNA_ORIENTATION=-